MLRQTYVNHGLIRACSAHRILILCVARACSPHSWHRYMSAIIGIVDLEHRRDIADDLSRMSRPIEHRGPDGRGIWCRDGVGLGHLMLFATPESLHEKLPLHDLASGLTITADARIDNREDLRRQLQLSRHGRDVLTDAELILAAYKKWGEDSFDRLIGDFAIAIWEERRRRLVLARDHFGVKPLYYFSHGGRFIFSTEVKSLLALDDVPGHINADRIVSYLTDFDLDIHTTSFKDIFRLPPSNFCVFDHRGVRISAYWQLDPDHETIRRNDDAYEEEFRHLFSEAVRCRLRTHGQTAVHLSGGLDSTSVACVAYELSDSLGVNRPFAVSNRFQSDAAADESEFIEAVLKQYPFKHYYVEADRLGPLDDMRQAFTVEDEAFLGPNHFLVSGLADVAAENGARVVLGGIDGDTVVWSDLNYYVSELVDRGEWSELIEHIRESVSLRYNPPDEIVESVIGSLIGDELRSKRPFPAVRGLIIASLKLPTLRSLNKASWSRVLSAAKKSLQKGERTEYIADFITVRKQSRAPEKPRSVKGMQHWLLASHVIAYDFESSDRMHASRGLDMRQPFMDKRLVEYCYGLPLDQKVRYGYDRFILRKSMVDTVPTQILRRSRKGNMAENFHKGLFLRNRQQLTEVVGRPHAPELSPFIDFEKLMSAVSLSVQVPHADRESDSYIWRAVSLASWHAQKRAATEYRPTQVGYRNNHQSMEDTHA